MGPPRPCLRPAEYRLYTVGGFSYNRLNTMRADDDFNASEAFAARLKAGDFQRLSRFIESELGIKMPPEKKCMLETRLRKRLRILRMKSFGDYLDFVFSPEGQSVEMVHMMDAVTTNKTDFFREPGHFDYLFQHALPELITRDGSGITRPMMVWSAGCSTGEEPYTLAMVLSEFALRVPGLSFQFTVLATDISSRVLEAARRAVYVEDHAEPVPMAFKKKYMLRSRDRDRGLVRITPELRETVKFRRLNLLHGDFGFREPLDVIFCRNVLIYFERATQELVVNHFWRCLRAGGYLFLGHSETLAGLDVPFRTMAPTVYLKEG